MGIDLLLVQLKLRLPQIFLLLLGLFHQFRYFIAHGIEGSGEHIDFFQGVHPGPYLQISHTKALCRLSQRIDRSGDGFCDHSWQDKARCQYAHKHCHKSPDALIHLLLQLLLKLFHVHQLIVGVLCDVILNHGAESFDIVLPDSRAFPISSRHSGIFNHPVDCRLQCVQAGQDSLNFYVAVRSRHPFNYCSEGIPCRFYHMDGILYHGGIFRGALQDIAIFKLGGINQADHNTVHGILHVFLEFYVVFVGHFQICHNCVVGIGVFLYHI